MRELFDCTPYGFCPGKRHVQPIQIKFKNTHVPKPPLLPRRALDSFGNTKLSLRKRTRTLPHVVQIRIMRLIFFEGDSGNAKYDDAPVTHVRSRMYGLLPSQLSIFIYGPFITCRWTNTLTIG